MEGYPPASPLLPTTPTGQQQQQPPYPTVLREGGNDYPLPIPVATPITPTGFSPGGANPGVPLPTLATPGPPSPVPGAQFGYPPSPGGGGVAYPPPLPSPGLYAPYPPASPGSGGVYPPPSPGLYTPATPGGGFFVPNVAPRPSNQSLGVQSVSSVSKPLPTPPHAVAADYVDSTLPGGTTLMPKPSYASLMQPPASGAASGASSIATGLVSPGLFSTMASTTDVLSLNNGSPLPMGGLELDSAGDTRADAARNEHARQFLPLSTSESELGDRYGIGIECYFAFARFLVMVNMGLFLASMITMIPRWFSWPTVGSSFFDTLFVISFAKELSSSWKGAVIVSMMLYFVIPALYYVSNRVHLRKAKAAGRLKHETDYVVTVVVDIPENKLIPAYQIMARRSVSLLIYAGLVVAVYYGTAGLQNLSNKSRATEHAGGFAGVDLVRLSDWGISALMVCMNLASSKLCRLLTGFEKYRTINETLSWTISKIFLFRGVTQIAFFQAVYYTDAGQCGGGVKFATLLFTDLLLGNAMELLQPYLQGKLLAWQHRKNQASDEANLADFDIAVEYTGLFFRQYLVYMSVAHVPALALLGAVCTGAKYWVDKYKLLRHSRRPTVMNRPLGREITAVMLVVAVFGIVGSGFAPALTLARVSQLPLERDTGSSQLIQTCYTYYGGAVQLG
ncbi:hypothetical protein BC828DRAFT_386993 [Blastocladiella britannica]|nr:hypothetical protein BC828DRAFT_386993 [Blastocladiella britannica]